MTGFSLSLPVSDTSVLLLSRSLSCRDLAHSETPSRPRPTLDQGERSRQLPCGRIDEILNPPLRETASRVTDDVGYELLSHRFDRRVVGNFVGARWSKAESSVT